MVTRTCTLPGILFYGVKELPKSAQNFDFGPCCSTKKTVFSDHSNRIPKTVFKTNYTLNQVKSIAECSGFFCIFVSHFPGKWLKFYASCVTACNANSKFMFSRTLKGTATLMISMIYQKELYEP